MNTQIYNKYANNKIWYSGAGGSHDNTSIVLKLCRKLKQSVYQLIWGGSQRICGILPLSKNFKRIFKYIIISLFDVRHFSLFVVIMISTMNNWELPKLWCKHREGKQTACRLHCYFPVCIISFINCSLQRHCLLNFFFPRVCSSEGEQSREVQLRPSLLNVTCLVLVYKKFVKLQVLILSSFTPSNATDEKIQSML